MGGKDTRHDTRWRGGTKTMFGTIIMTGKRGAAWVGVAPRARVLSLSPR